MEKVLFISPSTLDRKSLIMTLVFTLMGVICGGYLVKNWIFVAVWWGIMVALFAGMFVLGVICTPYKYILTNSQLIIKRHIKDIAIPLRKIEHIRLMTPDDTNGFMRTFGAESFFGSYGYYESSLHKKLILFARRYNNRTLIITDKKKYVIAPDDLQLIDATKQQIEQPETDNQTIMDASAKRRRRWLPTAIIVIVTTIISAIFVYLEHKDPKVEFDSNAFKLKGLMYGVTIPLEEVSKVDTIAWHEIPGISYRTNGFSMFNVKRGEFKTTDGDIIRMSIHDEVNPVIRIVDNNGKLYYINRKNANETKQIFNKLQK